MEVLAVREELLDLTERLVEEHESMPAGSVIRCVARCREELLEAGVRFGLVEAVEAMARHRLRARTSAVPLSVPPPRTPDQGTHGAQAPGRA